MAAVQSERMFPQNGYHVHVLAQSTLTCSVNTLATVGSGVLWRYEPAVLASGCLEVVCIAPGVVGLHSPGK